MPTCCGPGLRKGRCSPSLLASSAPFASCVIQDGPPRHPVQTSGGTRKNISATPACRRDRRAFGVAARGGLHCTLDVCLSQQGGEMTPVLSSHSYYLAFTLLLLGCALDKKGLCPCVYMLSSSLLTSPVAYIQSSEVPVWHMSCRVQMQVARSEQHLNLGSGGMFLLREN